MIATGSHWLYVNIGSVNGLVPSGNKQLSKPMSTRTEFNIAIWCHQDTFCGIMTPYNYIDLVKNCSLAAPSLFGAKPVPEQVDGLVIWNVMTAMLRHCKSKATKRDFGITDD